MSEGSFVSTAPHGDPYMTTFVRRPWCQRWVATALCDVDGGRDWRNRSSWLRVASRRVASTTVHVCFVRYRKFFVFHRSCRFPRHRCFRPSDVQPHSTLLLRFITMSKQRLRFRRPNYWLVRRSRRLVSEYRWSVTRGVLLIFVLPYRWLARNFSSTSSSATPASYTLKLPNSFSYFYHFVHRFLERTSKLA